MFMGQPNLMCFNRYNLMQKQFSSTTKAKYYIATKVVVVNQLLIVLQGIII